jgi:hypothetical protein
MRDVRHGGEAAAAADRPAPAQGRAPAMGRPRQQRRVDIPTERREKGHAGKVKLPELALELIRALPRVEVTRMCFRRCAVLVRSMLLPSSSGPSTVSSRPTCLLGCCTICAALRAACWRERLQVPDHIAERLLGHQLTGVQRVYNRHPYFEESPRPSASSPTRSPASSARPRTTSSACVGPDGAGAESPNNDRSYSRVRRGETRYPQHLVQTPKELLIAAVATPTPIFSAT